MNKLKQPESRLRARFAPRQGKSGSSLALVMTIGAALVIWVMAIMPTMTATGTTAVKLQNSQSGYLDGRSAIEFAKSELLHIVKDGVPYTFAVVRNTDASGNTTYDIVEKRDSGNGTNPEYIGIVTCNATDLDDVPTDNAVAAICAVTETASCQYTIIITAYADCEAGQTYTTTYTVSGNLLICPEAYNQTHALPLSDFVLVDGKLGSIQVWVSTIDSISATTFTETLIASAAANAADADAGRYPAVLKMTAMPAVGSGTYGSYTGITSNNGYTSSMLRGSQLYFMGETNSIDTKGNTIYLNADLLVLSNPIKNSAADSETTDYSQGAVYIAPYTNGKDDTLVYFGTACGAFKAKTVYKVKAGTDLCSPMSSDYEELGTVTSAMVKDLFAAKQYPEINLDIAYANKDQLMHIVSGETIGWTSDGVLCGSDTDGATKINAQYAVCAYVTEISGAVSRTANRVLVAAQEFDGDGVCSTDTLTVPADLSFTTRYLSVETDNIVQGSSGVTFKVYNLGQNQDFIDRILDFFDLTTYSSKTLQVDYERPTYIKLVSDTGAGAQTRAQICRYEDDGTNGVDIFTGHESENLLMVPYTAEELKNLYSASYWSFKPQDARIVERYVQFSGDSSGRITFDNSTFLDSLKMNVFANYIYIDSSVQTIVADSALTADVFINTQENGYSEGEYLHWFGSGSTESYNGTLVYVRNTITYEYLSNYSPKNVTIDPGFYFIPASSDGTSLSVLSNTNPDLEDYIVTNIEDYAIYIDESGTISQAYADTGLIVSGGSGATGFGGGSVG